jgi:hypothetical protein
MAFEVTVALPSDKLLKFKVKSTDTIKSFKFRIQEVMDIPVSRMRLTYDSIDLHNGLTLGEVKWVEEDFMLVLRENQVGMISTFTTTSPGDDGELMAPWVAFLLGGPQPADTTALARKYKRIFWPSTRYDAMYQRVNDSRVISAAQRELCLKFLDHVWATRFGSPPCGDMKVVFEPGALEVLLSPCIPGDEDHNPNAVDDLMNLHSAGSKIAMRCTRGPVPGAIGWHCDQGYSTLTVQLTLNDDTEYEGGRLCFYTEAKGLEVLARRAGCITSHDTNVLHAVTRLTSGTRYSLFAVDQMNGLGESGIITLSAKDVRGIYAHLNSARTPTRGLATPKTGTALTASVGTTRSSSRAGPAHSKETASTKTKTTTATTAHPAAPAAAAATTAPPPPPPAAAAGAAATAAATAGAAVAAAAAQAVVNAAAGFVAPASSALTATKSVSNEFWGEILFSSLTIGELIGRGEFKTVHRGTWTKTRSTSAMAVAVLGLELQRAFALRQSEVAEVLGRHQDERNAHLLRIFGSCSHQGRTYFVTELAPLGSLRQHLLAMDERGETMSAVVGMECALQVTKAMSWLSQLRIIHRNLAARNVMVFAFDAHSHRGITLKVADFELSRTGQSQGVDALVHYGVGEAVSPRWSSPEVLQRRRYSEKSDVWSFGVLVWEVFTLGLVPYFHHASDRDVITAVTQGELLPCPAGCPRPVYERVVVPCLEKAAVSRPMFAALQHIVHKVQDTLLTACPKAPLREGHTEDPA